MSLVPRTFSLTTSRLSLLSRQYVSDDLYLCTDNTPLQVRNQRLLHAGIVLYQLQNISIRVFNVQLQTAINLVTFNPFAVSHHCTAPAEYSTVCSVLNLPATNVVDLSQLWFQYTLFSEPISTIGAAEERLTLHAHIRKGAVNFLL